MDSFGLGRKERNAYLRYILIMLRTKYFVNIAAISKAVGFKPQNTNDFVNKLIHFAEFRQNKLENFLIDLYGSILEDEIPQDKHEFRVFIKTLVEAEEA